MIQEQSTGPSPIPIQRATELLGISKSGYYKHQDPDPKNIDKVLEDIEIYLLIQDIIIEFSGYGYRRVTYELWKRGYFPNHKRVYRIMKEKNLLCKRKKFKPKTTDSNHSFPKYPNLIIDLETTGPDQVWVSDITYIRLKSEFIYLAGILDLHTRRCIGWALSRNVDTNLTLSALYNAFETRKGRDLTGLIHHSDQGVQYAAHSYVECLRDHGILVSMSSTGNAYENAHAESFWKTLKYEEVYMNEYDTFEDALENIARFIEKVYNEKRMHSSLGYKSPIEFEKGVCLNIRA